MPSPLLDAIRGEIVLGKARNNYSFVVEYHLQGTAIEARVRSREVLHIVKLTT
jgi:hypothetical protein